MVIIEPGSSCEGEAKALYNEVKQKVTSDWDFENRQAIKFATKEDVYKYLETKYQDYTGEGLAKPFIMDNEKWVEMK